MSKRLVLLFILGLALLTAPSHIGCGSDSNCAAAGQSCLAQACCPHADGSVTVDQTFDYPGGVRTVTSCTCR